VYYLRKDIATNYPLLTTFHKCLLFKKNIVSSPKKSKETNNIKNKPAPPFSSYGALMTSVKDPSYPNQNPQTQPLQHVRNTTPTQKKTPQPHDTTTAKNNSRQLHHPLEVRISSKTKKNKKKKAID